MPISGPAFPVISFRRTTKKELSCTRAICYFRSTPAPTKPRSNRPNRHWRNLKRTNSRRNRSAKRETQLFEQKVESAQNRDNAVQANVAAQAEVKAQQAALRQAELNLQFTKITAPLSGIAGIANPGIGDLVGPSDAQPLTTMSTVNPIKAYLKISEQDYLKFARRVEQERAAGETAPPAEIILADGVLYPHQGKFSAVDRAVDQQTGTIRLAALFPNPDNVLRPGGFVRVRVDGSHIFPGLCWCRNVP